MCEHPSLNVNQSLIGKTAKETLTSLNHEVGNIKTNLQMLREQASTSEADFNSLDALTVLAAIETKLDAFIRRNDAVLIKAEANLDLEKQALNKLLGNAGQV